MATKKKINTGQTRKTEIQNKKNIKSEKPQIDFPIAKENYRYIIIGFLVVIIGFLLMIGGGSQDPNVFSEEIFSFRRITLAPMVVLFGFVFIIWAIMRKPKKAEN